MALVTPILLLLFAAAADFGRAFYAYVALENAVKEGAFYGSRAPACGDSTAFGCADPNNVEWRVQNELQGLANPDGTPVVPTSQCFAPGSTAPKSLTDCDEGDTFTVRAAYPFRPITPILGSVLGDVLTLRSAASATVLNAGNPTPGLSVQKYVDPNGALNASDVLANCQDPNDIAAPDLYRSPCLNTTTTDIPDDVLYARFETGDAMRFRVVVRNSGVLNLTNVTITDNVNGLSYWPPTSGACPNRPSSLPIGSAPYECTYTLTAPNVPSSGTSFEDVNVVTADATEVSPATDFVTVVVERPAELEVLKSVSPYRLGNDGDGVPSFGTAHSIDIGLNDLVTDESVWYRLIVRSVGGKTATGIAINDTNGTPPFGQSTADAECRGQPAELAPGASWECLYREPINASRGNTVTATADNVTPDGNDSATVTVTATACTGANDRVIPNVIGFTKAEAQAAWTAASMTGTLTWSGADADPVKTQRVQAYSCVNRNTGMTVTTVETP